MPTSPPPPPPKKKKKKCVQPISVSWVSSKIVYSTILVGNGFCVLRRGAARISMLCGMSKSKLYSMTFKSANALLVGILQY